VIEYVVIYEAEHDAGGRTNKVKMSAKRSTVDELAKHLEMLRARSPLRIGRVLELHKLTTTTEPMDVAILEAKKS
jgi:hypothetical protein